MKTLTLTQQEIEHLHDSLLIYDIYIKGNIQKAVTIKDNVSVLKLTNILTEVNAANIKIAQYIK